MSSVQTIAVTPIYRGVKEKRGRLAARMLIRRMKLSHVGITDEAAHRRTEQ